MIRKINKIRDFYHKRKLCCRLKLNCSIDEFKEIKRDGRYSNLTYNLDTSVITLYLYDKSYHNGDHYNTEEHNISINKLSNESILNLYTDLYNTCLKIAEEEYKIFLLCEKNKIIKDRLDIELL